ncbi:peptide ABC transporter permease [Solemya velum gill symbiont]|uniref:ABC transporter permease n=1 Tax=Solemya velum gill symbiont TaxID=2340 RepID=UPI0009970F94|nr:ABC transporter permease [Solemya velum gill symbiont]OOY84925.1 peptide ABC transporter permease [Solemya velum gill symbiont]
MRVGDTVRYGFSNVSGSPVRAFLLLLAMSIGVASVVMLSTLGEAARLYVVNQFSALGTHLLIVLPGRSETTGGAPPLLGAVPRDLTLDDSNALLRGPSVSRVAPIVVGSAPISFRSLEREATIIGTTVDYGEIREIAISQGRFLPSADIKRGDAVCVIGETIRQELFGGERALGQSVRINSYRYRVIGILGDEGQSLGMEMGDAVLIPVASAQALFNTESLFRIMVQATQRETIPSAKEDVIRILRERHDGEDDVTVITQDAILGTFDRILKALTYTVVGIAAISLAVAGVLIMNVMLVSVSQRTSEIGLLKALGGSKRQILILFLSEAALLSVIGAVSGILISFAGVSALDGLFPTFPLTTPLWAYVSALIVAIVTGLVFGIMPARRAARLDPVDALMRH